MQILSEFTCGRTNAKTRENTNTNYPEFPGRGTYVRGNLWTPVRDILVFENANQPFQEEKFC